MRRRFVALLVLAALAIAGWLAIELAGEGSAPPGGGEGKVGSAGRGAEDFHRDEPLLADGAPVAREHVDEARVRRPQGTLLVRVVDRASGSAVAGARLALDPSGTSATAEEMRDPDSVLRNPAGETDAITDELGEARIEVASGIRLRLRARDRGPDVGRSDRSIAPLAPGERREVLVEMPRGLDLDHWVRATAARGGEPVEGAAVTPVLAGAPLPPEPRGDAGAAVLTDREGLARLHVSSWRSTLARIDAAGFGTVIAAVVPGHDAAERAQVVALPRSASLTAIVAASPGIPLAGADLVLTLPAAEIALPRGTTVLAGDLVWSARTDEEGRCRIGDLPPDVPIRAELRRGDELLRRIADPWIFAPGEEAERSVQLGGSARLVGLLLGTESKPWAGAEIWLARAAAAPAAPANDDARPGGSQATARYFWTGTLESPFARTRTDEAGSFVFEGLERGDWWVGPAPQRPLGEAGLAESIPPRAELVAIPADAAEIEVILRARPGLWIRGRVVDPAGVAVAQTVVEARSGDALGAPSTRTSPEGSFALGPLGEGEFLVRARGRWGLSDSAETKVRAGDGDVELRLAPGAVLSGRAIDAESGAPCIAVLALGRHGAGEPRDASASSGRDGTFEFRGLAPGAYDLHGRTDDGRVGFLENVVVSLGASPPTTVLTFAPGARLRIEHRGGAAVGRFVVLRGGRIVAAGSTRSGGSSLVTVPAGPLTVRFTPDGGVAQERPIEAPPGAGETEVVFPSP